MDSPRSNRLLGLLALTLLGAGCVLVLWPFLTPLIWAAILASTSWPVFLRLSDGLGQRRSLAAALMTVLGTVALLGPIVAVTLTQADNVAELGRAASTLGHEGLPDAPTWLAGLPVIGPTLHSYWQQFAHDGQRLIQTLGKPLQSAALTGGRVLGQGVIDMALALFLSFFFFRHGDVLSQRLRVALEHLAGARAAYLLEIARGTVSGVIYGVLGTALAQGVLAAIGLAMAFCPEQVWDPLDAPQQARLVSWLRGIFGGTSPVELWFGILPISAGVFGVPVGFAVIIIVSLFTPAPSKETQELVENVRYPDLNLGKA